MVLFELKSEKERKRTEELRMFFRVTHNSENILRRSVIVSCFDLLPADMQQDVFTELNRKLSKYIGHVF